MSDAPLFCRWCGHDLETAASAEAGRARFDTTTRQFSYDGQRILLTGAEAGLVEALLKAGGKAVSLLALTERLDSRSDDPGNVLAVIACRVRRKLTAAGAPAGLVHKVRRGGYRWAEEAEAA